MLNRNSRTPMAQYTSGIIGVIFSNVHTTTCRAFNAAEMKKIVSKVHGG